MDSRIGYSDPKARVGRAYRTYGLGYKLHLTVDAATATPLAFLVAPATKAKTAVFNSSYILHRDKPAL